MFKSIILLNFIFLTTINCMSRNDFCFKNENKICTGIYDGSNLKYIENCEELKCKAPFSHECKDFCTTKKAYCTTLLLLRSYTKFDGSSKSCWNSNPKLSDFCVNGENCFLKTIYNGVNNSSQMDCMCPENKRFVCGIYCTKHSMICSAINKPIPKISDSKSCGNANTIYRLKKITSNVLIRF